MTSPSTEYALSLLASLADAGVRDVVLSPGSRSQALALAAAEFETAGRLSVHVRIDERSGGFLALGLAAETGVPSVVITTSGTAVANLHPAVLEAHHSGVPLIVLTADRPLEMRGIGSNQTTVQPGLFASAVGWVRDVEAPRSGPVDHAAVRTLAREAVAEALGGDSHGALGRSRGPVQLNVAFREPLSSGEQPLPVAHPQPVEIAPAAAPVALEVDVDPATLVVAGHAAGPEAEAVARALGAPLVAEVSSGARFGPHLVSSYRALLDDADFGGRVRRVVVFGHPTLSRQIPSLLTRDGVEVVVVRAAGAEAYDPSRSARVVEAIEVTRASSGSGSIDDGVHRAWVGRWVHTGRRLAEAEAEADVARPDADDADATTVTGASDRSEAAEQAEFLRREVQLLRRPVTRRALAEALWRVSWPHDRLVLGASRLIRELDQVVPGKKIPVHANRGLAGIDGTIATATGIALASQRDDPAAGTTRVLVGDLTLLHDVGSMLLGLGETRPRLQVVVGNDGGGTIFDGLEVAATASPEAMTRVQFTPHEVDLSALALAYGWQYVETATRAELDQALVARYDGPVLIEVPLSR
ncbi:2-succinyl-5-enolpyruvyl-6-hydroxy-3-cyclohexene-1-carboxylic-acid synthase [Frigoribacterium sp. MCBA15_019]|uniref:2-succinyl-5-enolpyruvyl-6-hydroxy-3- cyclohexene-1-carboxylic-acid synthase n=1 Tax=Frigoribacterium sp. MCBA15_019 TaxID=1898745 RepID=UPI0008DDE1BE|nr:2-succinyl-5-enolpyruvyl-6-hydroxy-3-cyclohexene-1-carboxylic-acid synthase [Frigoribacterium sp. MCBA15_019]OII26434.1 2-succinyl-5-enolpyruvyl-6-hydroxy-3-cyclohexene-1-carboxylic-acid synthase [Frigoribacterium sp. MCBA15_019]